GNLCIRIELDRAQCRLAVGGLVAIRHGAEGHEMLLFLPGRDLWLIKKNAAAARQLIGPRPAAIDRRRVCRGRRRRRRTWCWLCRRLGSRLRRRSVLALRGHHGCERLQEQAQRRNDRGGLSCWFLGVHDSVSFSRRAVRRYSFDQAASQVRALAMASLLKNSTGPFRRSALANISAALRHRSSPTIAIRSILSPCLNYH